MSSEASSSNNEPSGGIKVKCLIQQCLKAKLQTQLPDLENNIPSKHVEIERGAVLFVCFMKDAQESDVEKLVKSVLNVRLSEVDGNPSKHVSILELSGSLLIIPQATLGGRVKGRMVQYHNNVNKEKGLELYEKFIELCRKLTGENDKWKQTGCKIEHGTYGIRQVYSTETNGPYLHMIEF